MTTEEARQEIHQLVAKYERLGARAIKGYNEANTKDGFVRPLFEALGWDFSNIDEVEAEKTITPGRVDYLFELNGVAKFCLEVKALHVDINDERWIRQAIAYAYYKGVTWAVLTNFKTLRAFNAERETRDIKQIAFLNLTCGSYLTDFHRLWLLSREAVASGDLDKEAVAYGRLPPRQPVEKRLYAQLIDWRETLFNEVYLYYKDEGFTWSQVDQWIQQLLNRFIFIRTAEDRGLIDRKLLAALHQWRGSDAKAELMDRLRDIFHEFASLYDSDLFPQKIMDPWASISIYDSRALADIIQGLYEVPGGLADWDFATIGSDVLGTVYEQYLGYVPTRVKVEAKEAQQRLFPTEPHIGLTAKKEKRKGEGIYYTPSWVVDYIVKETVGRFVEQHSYDDILNMKILDPACGSGSFLTRAYEELLNYHARQQGKSPAELEQWERRRILLRNIYGVDLDQQAVEIARLSLLLCSLSGQETLPPLADNIRRGNSLISGTDEELRRYFGDRWEEKHRFNWEEKFPQIMKDGGFDVVIGNPPYLRVSGINENTDQYIRSHYETIFGHFDYYIAFLERAVTLLKRGGFLGFIVPNKFLVRRYANRFRPWLLDNSTILKIVDFSAIPVFEGTSIYPVVIVLTRRFKKSKSQRPISVSKMTPSSFETFLATGKIPDFAVGQDDFRKNKNCTFDIEITPDENVLFSRIQRVSEPLGTFAQLLTGTPAIDLFYKWGDLLVPKEDVGEDEEALPFLNVSNVERYIISWGREIRAAKKRLSTPYLRFHPEYVGKNKWRVFCIKPKIAIAGTAKWLTAALDEVGCANLSLYAVVDWESNRCYRINYLLGLINSSLLDFWFMKKFGSTRMSGGYLTYNGVYLAQLPIRCIDFENPEEQKMHDDLVALVERMLELNKRLAPIRNTPCNERDELTREIARTDRQIDNLVYDLYGLTKEETEIVKGEHVKE